MFFKKSFPVQRPPDACSQAKTTIQEHSVSGFCCKPIKHLLSSVRHECWLWGMLKKIKTSKVRSVIAQMGEITNTCPTV